MLFCKNCRHIVLSSHDASLDDAYSSARCGHPETSLRKVSVVSGIEKKKVLRCTSVRMEGWICGLDAKLFEPWPESSGNKPGHIHRVP
jgi:hypothetical protein